ncbi:MAG: hypothetical protein AAGJ81_16005 [Verrucomicrobiota bacterium]
MATQWTSRLSIAQLEEELSGRRLEVYSAIRAWDPLIDGPGPSIEDLAEKTGRKESSICGRLAELRHDNLVVPGPLKQNSTGKEAMTYIALAWKEDEITSRVEPSGQACFF